jgi:hypothetical protein
LDINTNIQELWNFWNKFDVSEWIKNWSDVWRNTTQKPQGKYNSYLNSDQWTKNWYDMFNFWITGSNNFMMVKPIFNEKPSKIKKGLIAMLMPFQDPFEEIYTKYVKPSLEKEGFTVQKADSMFYSEKKLSGLTAISESITSTIPESSTMQKLPESISFSSSTVDNADFSNLKIIPIIERIWLLINESELLIADVTNKNTNVFYELGLAHTIGKNVIIITQKEEDIPFDIRHMPHIIYSAEEKGKVLLTEKLVKWAIDLLKK